jgi:hypothetical protein
MLERSGHSLKRALIGVLLAFLLLVTGCGSSAGGSSNSGIAWIGTYSAPNRFGGFFGTISFTVRRHLP